MPKYAGTGKAQLLNANQQAYVMGSVSGTVNTGERTSAGTPNFATLAVLLARGQQAQGGFPFQFAVEISFSANPGTFEVDIQGSETDTDNSYCLLGTAITAVNSANYARFEGVNYYPKFVRGFVKTLGNDVLTTILISR
jgi:hypothetical protein